MKLKKLIIPLLFIAMGLTSHAQEIDSIQVFYQYILDSPRFIKMIEDNPEFKCGNTLLFSRSQDYDERFELYYKGNSIPILYYPDTAYCTTVTFILKKKNNQKFILSARLRKQLPNACEQLEGHGSGKCATYFSMEYYLIIKKKKKDWVIIEEDESQKIETATYM